MNSNTHHSLILLFATVIWGSALSAQSIGSKLIDTYTFLSGRCVFCCLFLLPFVFYRNKKSHNFLSKDKLKSGMMCGFWLFLGCLFQQLAITYTSAANCAFITAIYVVLVPYVALLFGHNLDLKIVICSFIALLGLYLLSVKGKMSVNKGDLWAILSALAYSFQIIWISRYSKEMDPFLLALLEFLFVGIVSTIVAFVFEHPDVNQIIKALPSLMYVGILSSGIGYTCQIIGQRGLNPSIASMIMSLESVWAAFFGWIILKETLTGLEIIGCALLFIAVLSSQLFIKE